MAFCCSSIREGPGKAQAGVSAPKNRWAHKAAASAAVDVSNLLVHPGTKVPTKSIFTHSKVPATHDISGKPLPDAAEVHGDYYSNLTEMSPAAPLAPIKVRDHASTRGSSYGGSVGSVTGSSLSSGWDLSAGNPSACGTPSSVRSGTTTPKVIDSQKVTAWKREVSEWKQEIETCLNELADAIRREDFEVARKLKAKRDYLKSRPLPEPPSWDEQTPTSEVPGATLVHYSTNSTSSAQSQASNVSKPHQERPALTGRADSGGLGFLFTVWSHNPQHTPKPDCVHS